jgi:aryl-alcohol dehydrogenase-like predicted oxidoreductase
MQHGVLIEGHDVGAIGFGTAPIAFKDVTRSQAVRLIHAALDAGVRFVDTALAYTRPGVESFAETVIATALAGWSSPDAVMVATKGGHRRVGDAYPVDARPSALRSDCETSLRSLGVDSINLYQLHHVDPTVSLAESVGALAELRDRGMVRHIGLSNVGIDQIRQACAVAPIASVQNRLAWDNRQDLATVAFCAAQGIAYLAYMPLGGSSKERGASEDLDAVAARHGVSPERVRLAWLRAQGPHVLPLVGASQLHTLQDSVAAATLELDEADLQRLG